MSFWLDNPMIYTYESEDTDVLSVDSEGNRNVIAHCRDEEIAAAVAKHLNEQKESGMRREEVYTALIQQAGESRRALECDFGPSALGTTVIRNQLVMLNALSYLVEHMTEQAWKNHPVPTCDTTGAAQ